MGLKLMVLFVMIPLIYAEYNIQIGNNALREALNTALWETLSANGGAFPQQLSKKWIGTAVNFTTDCGVGVYAYPPRPADGTLAKVLDTGVAKVGFGPDFAPYYFKNGTSTYVGLSVELIDAVLVTLGNHYKVSISQQQVISSNTINTYLTSDFETFDFSARFLTGTIDRRQLAVWTCDYWPSNAKVAVNTALTYEELVAGSYKFATQTGSFFDQVRATAFPNSIPVYSSSTADVFANLLSGENGVVATVNDEAVLEYAFGGNSDITILDTIAETSYIGWQVRYERCSSGDHGNTALQQAINSALSTIDYASLYAKYADYDLSSYNFAFSCPLANTSVYPKVVSGSSLDNMINLKSASVAYGTALAFYYAGTPYSGFVVDIVDDILETLSTQYSANNITQNQVVFTTPASTYLTTLNQVDFSARLLTNSNTARNQIAAWTCNMWRFSYRVMSKNATNEVSDFNTPNNKFSYLNGSLIYNVITEVFPLAQTQAYSSNTALLDAVRDGTDGVTATVQDYAIIENYIMNNPSSGLVQLEEEIGSDDLGFQLQFDSCDIGTYAGTTGESASAALHVDLTLLVVGVISGVLMF